MLQNHHPLPYGIYCIPVNQPDTQHWELARDAKFICFCHGDIQMPPVDMVAKAKYYDDEKKNFDEIIKKNVFNIKRIYYEVWLSKNLLCCIFKKVGERDLYEVPVVLLKAPGEGYLQFLKTRYNKIMVEKKNWPLAARCASVFENGVDTYYSKKNIGNFRSFTHSEQLLMNYEDLMHDGWRLDQYNILEDKEMYLIVKEGEKIIKNKIKTGILCWFELDMNWG